MNTGVLRLTRACHESRRRRAARRRLAARIVAATAALFVVAVIALLPPAFSAGVSRHPVVEVSEDRDSGGPPQRADGAEDHPSGAGDGPSGGGDAPSPLAQQLQQLQQLEQIDEEEDLHAVLCRDDSLLIEQRPPFPLGPMMFLGDGRVVLLQRPPRTCVV